MTDLNIPAEAVSIVADHVFGEHKAMPLDEALDVAAVALEDAAPLIVAAELRAQAKRLGKLASPIAGQKRFWGPAADLLLDRADELDPR